MIRVTVWNENVQERGEIVGKEYLEENKQMGEWLINNAKNVLAVHPNGIHNTIADYLKTYEDFTVRTATLDMEECGLTDEVLNTTDVLIWWGHVAHHLVPDYIVEKVQQHVQKGMGFIALHSAHQCKPLVKLLGTTGSLQWREGDFSRVWCTSPTHPIASGIPASFELPEEEMYGELFDIPKPDDIVFLSWFRGGEVFRSGCTWTRGYGKIFYFQPGHETNLSYKNENVLKVISNAVKWANPTVTVSEFSCPHTSISPEAKIQSL